MKRRCTREAAGKANGDIGRKFCKLVFPAGNHSNPCRQTQTTKKRKDKK